MTQRAEGEVVVWRDSDGTVVCGPELVAPAGRCSVPLRGGTLVVDPMSPQAEVAVRISGDPQDSADTVAALFGEQAADAVTRVADDPISVPMADSDERVALSHLAVLSWLDVTTPLPLDPRLLTVEGLVIEADHLDLLAPDSGSEGHLVEWLPTLVEWAQRSHEPQSALADDAHLASTLSAALHLALAASEPGPYAAQPDSRRSLLADAAHHAELLEARVRLGLPHLDPDAALAALAPLRPKAAVALGGEPSGYLHGVCGVDWTRVPRGSVAPHEEAVSWRLTPMPTPHLSVVVAAGPTDASCRELDTVDQPSPEPPRLQATVFHPGWPTPLAVVDLIPRGETAAWLGTTNLGPSAFERITELGADGVIVDIHAAGLHRRPRLGVDGSIAAATRWAARGLTAARIAAAYPPDQRAALRSGAASAFTMAARLFRASTAARAQEAAARCEFAARTLGGSSATAASGPRVWRPAADPSGALGPSPIDLEPRLSVAETWYAARLRPGR